MKSIDKRLVFAGLGCVMALPVIMAAFSPYLTFRDPIYIGAGFAGILCLSLFVVQPLLSTRILQLSPPLTRQLHRLVGLLVLALTLAHVVGLYVTSPPDVIDALLLRAPTLFSVFGVFAFWAVLLTAVIAKFRHRIPSLIWPTVHKVLSASAIAATIIHALQIDGAMEPITKWIVCLVALGTVIIVLVSRQGRK